MVNLTKVRYISTRRTCIRVQLYFILFNLFKDLKYFYLKIRNTKEIIYCNFYSLLKPLMNKESNTERNFEDF